MAMEARNEEDPIVLGRTDYIVSVVASACGDDDGEMVPGPVSGVGPANSFWNGSVIDKPHPAG